MEKNLCQLMEDVNHHTPHVPKEGQHIRPEGVGVGCFGEVGGDVGSVTWDGGGSLSGVVAVSRVVLGIDERGVVAFGGV